MIRFARVLAGSTILALLLILVPATAAQNADPAVVQDASKENVLITFRIGKLDGGNKVPVKKYDLVVAAGTMGSKLLSGERVPFPAVAGETPGGEAVVYQNVGFLTEANAWIVDEKTIRLVATIEDSRLRESTDGNPPRVETRQLSISAVLTDGVPLELTRVEGEEGRSGYVEAEAKILR